MKDNSGRARLARHWPFLVLLAVIASGASVAATKRTLVERGEYLARAGDCMGCHTAKGGAPFAGGRFLETPFGYMLSTNITPDAETGIGRMSRAAFYRSLHRGVNRHGKDMYPTMPYDFYTNVTRSDVDAIYAYLRTVKPVHNVVAPNHLRFPFDLRWTMGAWRELYFNPGPYQPNPAKSAAWNRGAYLVEGLGHCSDCHSPRNLLGGIEKSKDFSGAVVDGWFALDLTDDIVTGLGAWSVDDIARYLRTGVTPSGDAALGPMAEFIRDSTSHLDKSDRLAMAEYLKSLPPDSRLRTGRVVPDPTRRRGARLYTDNCSGCHGSRGRGVPGIFPRLVGNPEATAGDPRNLLRLIEHGIPTDSNFGGMPGFAGDLNDRQIAEIANYVRTSWGNHAEPNATSALAARLRTGHGGR